MKPGSEALRRRLHRSSRTVAVRHGPRDGALRSTDHRDAPFDPREAFYRVRKAVPEPWPTIHSMRHSAATWWLASGLGVHAVADLLGHAADPRPQAVRPRPAVRAERRGRPPGGVRGGCRRGLIGPRLVQGARRQVPAGGVAHRVGRRAPGSAAGRHPVPSRLHHPRGATGGRRSVVHANGRARDSGPGQRRPAARRSRGSPPHLPTEPRTEGARPAPCKRTL
jgi:hypothetical protein